MWMLTGSVLGWVGYSYLNFNEERGVVVSVIIGALGGFIGGKVIAPMFTVAAAVPADFSVFALFFAAAVAAAFLAASNMVYDRWGGVVNWDRIQGNWKQLKGIARQQWGRLTADYVGVVAGKRQHLLGEIEAAYGI